MAIITSVGEDGEKLEPFYNAGWNAKWYSPIENSRVGPQKVKFRITTLSCNSSSRYTLKRTENLCSKYVYSMEYYPVKKKKVLIHTQHEL